MEIKTACPLKACWIKTCFSDTTLIFMQEEKEKYYWILVKSLPLFYPSTSKCSRNSHPLKKKKKKKDSKVNSQRHSGKNKSRFYTSGPLNKVCLKASEPAEMRRCCQLGPLPLWAPWSLPVGAAGMRPHACLVSLPWLIANFLSINYKVQSSPCGVWNREWGLTLEQRLSNSPIHSVHLRPRTHTAKRYFPPLSGKSLWN